MLPQSINGLWSRIEVLFRRRRLSHDIEDELHFHLEQRTQENMAAGMPPEEARRAARLSLGNPVALQEETREVWTLPFLESLWQDVRYGLRQLRRNPGFTIVAIGTLALGIGANSAVFGLVDQAAFEPLPVRDPGSLVQMVLRLQGSEFSNISYPEFRPLVEDDRSFSGMFIYAQRTSDMEWGAHAERVHTLLVSGSYYSVLGVSPFLGRALAESDDRASAPPAAMLSYGFWKRTFGDTASALGQSIFIEGRPFTIVGITPPSFFGLNRLWTPDVIVPFSSVPAPDSVYCVGRLKPSVTDGQALAELSTSLESSLAGMSAEMEKWPTEERQHWLGMSVGLLPAGVGDWGLSLSLSSVLPVLMVSVGVLLLIACTNLASLLLARGSARSTELRIRVALGAGRWRVMRQLLTEALLLGAAGGLAGLAVAFGAYPLLASLLPLAPDAALRFPIDFRLLAFTAAASLLTVLLFAVLPALRATRGLCESSLGGAGASEARYTGSRPTKALLIAQLAASMVLLTAAGLLVHTIYNLDTLNPGFDSGHLLLVNIDPKEAKLGGPAASQMERDLLRRVRALPGVRSAALALTPLFGGGAWQEDIFVEGYTYGRRQTHTVAFNVVSPDFFATAGIPLVLGRDFGPQDLTGPGHVAIVNEAFARKYFPDEDPIGGRFGNQGRDSEAKYKIVGMVRNAKYWSLREKARPAFFQLLMPSDLGSRLVLHVRTAGDPAAIARLVRQTIGSVNQNLVVYDTRTMPQQINETLGQEHTLAAGAGIFALLALGLACLGVYGVAAYSVARRRREIGIRMALGAQPGEILGMILRGGLWLSLASLAIGGLAAWPLSHLLRGLLFGVSPVDPITLATVAALLTSVALIASWIPARRASRVDPVTALKYE